MREFTVNRGVIKKVISKVLDEFWLDKKRILWEEKERLNYDIVRFYEELDTELRVLEDVVKECRISINEILNQSEINQVLNIKKLRDVCSEENLLRLDSERLDLLLKNLESTIGYIDHITWKICEYGERKKVLESRLRKMK